MTQRRLGSWTRVPPACGLLVMLTMAISACSIPVDDEPRDIATEDQRALPLGVGDAAETTGSGRIYLLSRGQSGQLMLRSVAREDANDPAEALRTLFEGPNRSELQAGVISRLPPDIRLRTTTRLADSLTINVTGDLLDPTGEVAIQAIAQIVATASEFDDIRSVWLRVEGEDRSWPDDSGDLQSEALTIFDYTDLIETSQPALPPIPSGN